LSISDLIRRRRAVFTKFYIPGKPISRDILEQLLQNANWAPSHRLTQPWRFKVFHSEESHRQLSDYFIEYYRLHTSPELFSAEKMQKTGENALRAGAAIAICMQRHPESGLPEFEEIASVAMAVQNMWLSCTEIRLGCYWSTPKAILEASEFLELGPDERCLGLLYLGWHEMPDVDGKRGPIEEKVVWR